MGLVEEWSGVAVVRMVLTRCVKRDPSIIQGTEYEHYERTIDMLNKTFRMCLR